LRSAQPVCAKAQLAPHSVVVVVVVVLLLLPAAAAVVVVIVGLVVGTI
jgi:hypothetical protein